ncbi:TnsD family Tn7-like transposition protein [Pseudomonas mohnii]
MSVAMGFFPTPFPDETLHSILSRYCRLGGWVGFSVLREDPSEVIHFARATALPCGITELVKKIGLGSPFSVETLIDEHTLAAYFRPFLSTLQAKAVATQMADGPALALELRLGIAASMLAKFQRIRYCEVCTQVDATNFGQPYWHRAHQLPGVWVCPHHAKVLAVIDARWSRHHLGTPFLPDDDAVKRHSYKPQIDRQSTSELRNLALLSQSLLRANLSPLIPENLHHNLQTECVDKGFSDGHRFRLKRLAHAAADYFRLLPDAEEFLSLSSPDEETVPAWIMKLLRKPRFSHHPLKYLILMRILGLQCDQLAGVDRPPSEALKVRERDDPVSDSSFGHFVIPEGSWSLRQLSRLNGASVGAIKTALIRQGIAVRQFPRVVTPALIADIQNRATAGESSTAIASVLDISPSSVNRAIRIDPAVQRCRSAHRFEERRAQNRGAFLADIKEKMPRGCPDYMWLYRNDRDWLRTIIAESHAARALRVPRVDWEDRDQKLSARIFECAALLRSRPGKPRRISVAMIGSELSATDDFEKRLHHLPQCDAALTAIRDTPHGFLERRLRWAISESLLRGTSLAPSRLQRLIGLKNRNPLFDRLRLKLLADDVGR